MCTVDSRQGRSQEFAKGDKRGGLGDGSPHRGPGAESRWGSGDEAPRSRRHVLISSYDGGTCIHAPPPWLRH